MAPRELPDQETLRKLLHYEPETGALTWRERPASMWKDGERTALHCSRIWNARYAGQAAFTAVKRNGYLYGSIGNRHVHAHRVAYKWMTGTDPQDVDHIDGDRTNNRFANLRSCTRRENLRNAKRNKRNRTGVVGVRFKRGSWNVRIGSENVGTFATLEEAAAARRAAEQRLGYHANHGR